MHPPIDKLPTRLREQPKLVTQADVQGHGLFRPCMMGYTTGYKELIYLKIHLGFPVTFHEKVLVLITSHNIY